MKKRISVVLSLILAIAMMIPTITASAASFRNVQYRIGGTSFTYTGNEIKPTIKLTTTATDSLGNQSTVTLTEGVDYTLEYKNNVKVGLATVRIVGAGSYQGTKSITATYKIKPTKGKCPSVQSVTSNSVTMHWKGMPTDSGITGYKVYTCNKRGEDRTWVASTKTPEVTVKKLTNARIYHFVVRPYKEVQDGILYGEYSAVRTTSTAPNKVPLNSVTSNKDKTAITVRWSQRAGNGYQIKYSTSSSFKNAKVITVKDKTITSKKIKLDAKKTYYVKIRAYREFAPNKFKYGEWSTKMSNNFSKQYATYYSYYVNDYDRTCNLKIASKAINGTILKPGETFSFNQVVGQRTSAKGYRPAHVFAGSAETVMGLGGGVCQVASTMFNCALLANMQIVERSQHSQRVAYVPLGRDAAIYWGSQDFKFKNNTDSAIKIVMHCADGKISCTFMVCENVKPKKVSLNVSQNGTHFRLTRTVDGKVNYSTNSNY